MDNYNSTPFTFELAQEIYNADKLVDFDWAWKVLDYSTKSNAKRTLSSYFKLGFDYFVQQSGESLETLEGEIFITQDENSKAGRPSEKIYLKVDCFKQMAMLAKSERGELIRRYFLECEAIAKEHVLQMPDIVSRLTGGDYTLITV